MFKSADTVELGTKQVFATRPSRRRGLEWHGGTPETHQVAQLFSVSTDAPLVQVQEEERDWNVVRQALYLEDSRKPSHFGWHDPNETN